MSVRKDRFGPKGKYFTEVVSKTPTACLIQTSQQRIRGIVHLGPDHRLIDELNNPPPFLAVTDVQVLDAADETTDEIPFLALSKGQILWVIPLEDEIQEHEGTDG